MKVKIINKSENPLPEYKTELSAGVDIRAHLPEGKMSLKPRERKMVPTGLYIELPEGYEAQVRPRSGLAVHNGVTVLNSPGTIDADYRGEIIVILINLSDEDFIINSGDRIAQMVIARHEHVKFEAAYSLEDTTRGAGGFGHTGVQ